MIINANTKIARLIKEHPDALEAIISINPKFERLRNPLLRKILAGRASIAMACTIAGCEVQDFFEKLKPLGFEIDATSTVNSEKKQPIPLFMQQLSTAQIIEFDVRDLLASGKDPLTLILDKIKSLEAGQALKIINTFKPVPLIKMLEKQGFAVYTETKGEHLVETYFYKQTASKDLNLVPTNTDKGWDDVLHRFKNKFVTIDVRALEMPQPMLTILEALDKLPQGKALFVEHKRIPVFLLPELADRKLEFRSNEIGDGHVQLIIFRS